MSFLSFLIFTVNKHKPWIETSYHGMITENMDTVLLDPPLVAIDKDAPVPYAGRKSKVSNPLTFTAYGLCKHVTI